MRRVRVGGSGWRPVLDREAREAVADVVRYRTRFGDLIEVADLAIALDAVGAYCAARHFRRTAAVLRDEYATIPSGSVAFSKRLGDPYCVFDALDSGGRWNIPRWVVDSGQVMLLAGDVMTIGLALGRRHGSREERREGRSAVRFVRELARSLAAREGLIVDLPGLPANQPLS